MIRFACPGCGATYSVDDAKGGKTGKCPKCQSQFVIPAADPSAPVAALEGGSQPHAAASDPAPPAIDPTAPVEIAPCPGCQARLSVAASDLGVNVECPYCRTVYAAVRPESTAASAPSSRRPRTAYPDPDADDRPRSRARDDDDDLPSRRRRDDEEDDYDDRPRKKKKKKQYADVEGKKIAAGLLAILLGGYGVHKFYLGYTGAGVLQLVLTFFTCGIGAIIPLIEGIMYLTKSDEEFIETYQIGTKEWF
jgi:TM2 domain-containing membrane protein YozV